MTELPPEVFEEILCQIPLSDLLSSGSRVCKSWNKMISEPSFIPWKKTYYMLKADVQNIRVDIEKTVAGVVTKSVDTFHLKLIVHMSTTFKRMHVTNGQHDIKKHRLYGIAERLIREKVPECIENNNVNMWAMVTALVVLSKAVQDIYDILIYLTNGPCSVQDALEVLYCIATFSYVMRKYGAYGLHYRVFYTLYLYENVKKISLHRDSDANGFEDGNQLKNGCEEHFQLTREQMRIVDHCLDHDIVKIVGFAGSGKTSTLIEFARRNPILKILFVLHNNNLVEQDKKNFPSNLDCRTMHSLAWRNQECKLDPVKINPFTVLPFLKHGSHRFGFDKHAKLVIVTIENFIASVDENVTVKHVPKCEPMFHWSMKENERVAIAEDALLIWQKMINPKDLDVNITHNSHLKLYQLEHPVLNDYDCIIIDNAQDHSAAVLDILLSQKCPKILAVDSHQKMHTFGDTNSNTLDNVASARTYHLTQSFRFGPEIAQVAAVTLETMKPEERRTLVGGTQKGSLNSHHVDQVAACYTGTLFEEVVRIRRPNFVGAFAGSISSYHVGQVAILACYTGTLFEEVVRMGRPNFVGAFAGGISSYGFDDLVAIYNLKEGRLDITDQFFGKFKNIDDLESYAKRIYCNELLVKIQLVRKYTFSIPTYVEFIKSQFNEDISTAKFIFSTVQNAKGMEFDTVCLLDDFCSKTHFSIGNQPPLFEELYTAITRAKKCLCMPRFLKNLCFGL